MVLLTRLDGREVLVNDDLVVIVDRTPDTVMHLTTGDRIVVREPLEDVMERVIAFRRRVFAGVSLAPLEAPVASPPTVREP